MSTKSILEIYQVVETGQPVLAGHVMKKIFDKYGSQRKIEEWATLENNKNGFPPITLSRIKKFYTMYTKRHQRLRNLQKLKEECKKVAHSPSTQYSTRTATATIIASTPTVSETTSSTPAVSTTTIDTPIVSTTTIDTPIVSDTTQSTPASTLTSGTPTTPTPTSITPTASTPTLSTLTAFTTTSSTSASSTTTSSLSTARVAT